MLSGYQSKPSDLLKTILDTEHMGIWQCSYMSNHAHLMPDLVWHDCLALPSIPNLHRYTSTIFAMPLLPMAIL